MPAASPVSSAAGASGSSPISPRSRASSATRWTWSARCRGTRLAALFAPEHGITGAAQDQIGIGGERHRATGLPVWSLYGRRLAPTQASLRGLGALVVDLQDVGSRYYTYVWTMTLAMRECARAGVPVVVLDRPNPLGGERLEGNIAAPGYSSFVGLHPAADTPRHDHRASWPGYLNETHGLGCDLTVVPMQGWRRAMLLGGHGAARGWRRRPTCRRSTPRASIRAVASSRAPTCPRDAAPRGRSSGWARPTSTARAWPPRSSAARLPGVRFRATAFEPAFHKWRGRRCEGVQVHVTDRARFRPFLTYLALIARGAAPGRPALPLAAAALRVRVEAPGHRSPLRRRRRSAVTSRAAGRCRALDRELDGRPRALRPRAPAVSPLFVSAAMR